MNTRPVSEAKCADLRGSWPALQRAAQRARELAILTGTDLIVVRNGVIDRIKPGVFESAPQTHESHPSRGERP